MLNTTSSAVNGVPSWKRHVRAQLELPGGRVQRLPGQGELRHDRQVGIDIEKLLVDLHGCAVAVFSGFECGSMVDAPPDTHGEAQHVLRRGRAGEHQETRESAKAERAGTMRLCMAGASHGSRERGSFAERSRQEPTERAELKSPVKIRASDRADQLDLAGGARCRRQPSRPCGVLAYLSAPGRTGLREGMPVEAGP